MYIAVSTITVLHSYLVANRLTFERRIILDSEYAVLVLLLFYALSYIYRHVLFNSTLSTTDREYDGRKSKLGMRPRCDRRSVRSQQGNNNFIWPLGTFLIGMQMTTTAP